MFNIIMRLSYYFTTFVLSYAVAELLSLVLAMIICIAMIVFYERKAG